MIKKRIVVRVEIETLSDDKGKLNLQKMDRLAMLLANLNNSGKEILLISSGAIALGMEKLGIAELPEDFSHMQAVGAVGQAELIKCYQNVFDQYNEMVAQVLLTDDIKDNEKWWLNTRNTFDTLLQMGIIPIINENDVVSITDIELGDNYPLARMVADVTNADIILIKLDGDYDYIILPRAGTPHRVTGESELFDDLEEICGHISPDTGHVSPDTGHVSPDTGFPVSVAEILPGNISSEDVQASLK